ncbi:MAG: CPBP family intramembrane glutamic endopeptidase [Anaerolineales bacterium]
MQQTAILPRFDWKIVTITILSTLLLMVDYYHRLTPYKAYDRVLLYLVIPLLVIVLVFRESPAEYGFRLGDWRAGLLITVGASAVMTLILWLLLRGDESMQTYYAPFIDGPIPLPLYTMLELIGWEFLFRGWILFGYARKFGPEAMWLQAFPFALVHIGKPEIETLSTIFGGFAFGWVAWRTRSFLYPFLIHWYIFTLVVLLAGGFFG